MGVLMPKQAGVYQDGRGGWYFKATLGTDSLTGRRVQITRRGFASAFEAQKARRLEMERGVDGTQKCPSGP
jgi:Arm DNA-binding domain